MKADVLTDVFQVRCERYKVIWRRLFQLTVMIPTTKVIHEPFAGGGNGITQHLALGHHTSPSGFDFRIQVGA
jgi:hypothetical protein